MNKKWCNKLKISVSFGLEISESLDYKTTIKNIIDTSCAEFCDGWILDLFRNQNLVRVAEGHKLATNKIIIMAILKGQLIIDAVIENKVVLINDLAGPNIEPFYKEEIRFLESMNIQSLLILPLVLAGKKIGAITFVNTEDNKKFHKDRVTLLEGVCTHVSSALERARLHESIAAEAKNRYDLIELASHKIRTPLTSLKLQLQSSSKKNSQSEASVIKRTEVERFLGRLNLHLNKISEHVDNMIDLNEINQKIELKKQRVRLRHLVYEVEASLACSFEEARCEVW